MARRKRVPKIRLEHRLPNASPLFVGRERELDWLATALERGPLALVTGPGGIGKTALALRLVHERFRDNVRRTVFFGLRPGAQTAQLRLDLLRVLVQSTKSDVDLPAIADDPEALTEAAIDVAEEHELWVVLDDAHHADGSEMGELLTMLASYARDSRWIVTSRMEPKSRQLRQRVLALGGLGDAELTSIARELAGDDETAVHRAVASSAGSPWFLQQYVSSGQSGLELSRERLLENLDPGVDPFLRALGAVRVPLPESVLGLFTEVPEPSTLAALERRGLLQRDPSGLRLHDAVAGWLGPTDTANHDPIATALAATGEPVLIVEAARLHRDAGSLDALAELLDAHAIALFAQAQAPRLWAVIGEISDARIVKHQLRCAAELGNPTALAAVHEPSGEGPREQLAWASTVYAQGEVAKAQTLTTALTASTDLEVKIEATLLRARCLLNDAEGERALHELKGLGELDARSAFRRDALAARAATMLGHGDGDARVAELRRRCEAMPDVLDALHDVAVAQLELGRTQSADELLERIAATPRGGHASLLLARAALLTRASLRLQAGELREASVLLDAVRPYVRSASLLRPVVVELDARRRIAVGDVVGLDASIDTASAEAGDRRVETRLAIVRERLALICGESLDEGELVDAPVPERASLLALRARRAIRWGRDGNAPNAPVERRLFEADWALAHGEAAEDAARAAVHEAVRIGDGLLELEARLLLADATSPGPRRAHEAAVRELVDHGRTLSSARARLHADLHERFDDPAVLERVATFIEVAPTAARRARALLGGDVVLDAVDQRVVKAFRERAPTLAVRTVISDGPDWRPGWGLDTRRQHVWLPDGRSVDLSSKAIPWRLLSALVRRRGEPANKETLVLEVWGERTYHPGRHDPRVHMSIRKLRELLEDDPSQPTRLMTAEEGYRVGGRVRIIESSNL